MRGEKKRQTGNSPDALISEVDLRSSGMLLLAAMLVVSLNLRPLIAGVPPLLTRIEEDLRISSAIAGLVTTVAVICMAIFSPLATILNRKFSAEWLIMGSLALICLGSLLRLPATNIWLLCGSTFIGGIGIAVCGSMMPTVVRHFFPSRAGFATGIYSLGLTGGAAIASSFAVPLADALGSWQRSVASWSILGVLGMIAWIGPVRRSVKPHPDHAPPKLPWRSTRAWLLTGWLMISSVLFYCNLTWLAPFYEAHGYSQTGSGYLLGLFSAGQIIASLVVPALADRRDDRRLWLGLVAVCTVVGMAMTAFAPMAVPWFSVALLAFGAGGTFTLGLTFLVDYAESRGASSSLSGMCFLFSYTAAAISPPIVGAVKDGTGSFAPAYVAMFALSLIGVVLAFLLRPASHWTGRSPVPVGPAE